MKVELIKANDARWPKMLGRVAHDFYHLPEYVLLEARRCGGSAVAIYGRDADNHEFLIPLLIRELPGELGLPDSSRDAITPYGYGAPLSTRSDAWSLGKFLRAAIRAAQAYDIIALFVRWHPLLAMPKAASVDHEALIYHGRTVVVDLTETPEQWQQQTRSELRYSVRRLKKLGFRVVFDNWSMLLDFYHLYLATMRRLGAESSYHYSLAYLSDLKESLGSVLHLGTVVSQEGAVAASGLFTECAGIVQYHLSGSDERFLRLAPTKLLLDEVRHWAKERGNKLFHLGGGVNGSEDSLFEFKAALSQHRGIFRTSRIIADVGRYQTALSAHFDGELLSPEGYFPAYREAA